MSKARNSNIEMLRLIAMFFIIAGHYLSYSGLMETTSGINQILSYLIGSGARVAVSVFLIIGIWYMADSKANAKRILSLYFQIWFYGVLITALLFLFKQPVSKWSLLRVIFPFFLRSTWFGTAYISLLAVSPFLSKIFTLGQEFVKKLIVVFSLISIPFIAISGFDDTWLAVMFWFIYMYFLVTYYKKYVHSKVTMNRYIFVALGGVLYVLMALGKMVCFNHRDSGIFDLGYKLLYLWIIDYKQIPNLLCAFSIFYFFITAKPKENKLVNFLAKGTFSMYIVHQIPPMESYLWNGILKCPEWGDSRWFIPYSLAVVAGIGLIAAVLDGIRRKWIEPLWMNTCIVKKMEEKGRYLIHSD